MLFCVFCLKRYGGKVSLKFLFMFKIICNYVSYGVVVYNLKVMCIYFYVFICIMKKNELILYFKWEM